MKTKKFKLSRQNTVNASLQCAKSGKLLATLYDSGFTTIKQVQSALFNKVAHFTGLKVIVSITDTDKEQNKTYKVKVN